MSSTVIEVDATQYGVAKNKAEQERREALSKAADSEKLAELGRQILALSVPDIKDKKRRERITELLSKALGECKE